MIAFHPRRRGRLAVAVALPCKHRLADMDAPIVHQVGFDDPVSVGLENPGDGDAEQVVADMAEMQRLVGVGRRIFDHHRASRRPGPAVIRVGGDLHETLAPEPFVEREVQKSLDDVEPFELRIFGHHAAADFGRRRLGTLAAPSEQGENHQRKVAFKLPAGLLNLQRLTLQRAVKCFHRAAYRIRNKAFNIHNVEKFICKFSFFRRITNRPAPDFAEISAAISAYANNRYLCRAKQPDNAA